MLHSLRFAALGLVLATGVAMPAMAEPTALTVRVLAADAKFIGTSMGGAKITVRDAQSGAVLAEGLTEGGTGDTARIMTTPHTRGMALSTEGAASFSATLDISEPRLIEVIAEGPMKPQGTMGRASSTRWMIPGKPITAGDGWLLTLSGFAMEFLTAPIDQPAKADAKLPVRVKMTLMCGCPVEPAGLWDADRYEVAAIVTRGGQPVGTFPLAFAGKTNEFEAMIPASEPGAYAIAVYAFDPASGNTGLTRTSFTLSE